MNHRGFRMFNDYDLRSNQNAFITKLKNEVETDRNAANAQIDEYVNSKIEKYKMNPLILHTDKITVSQREVQIPAEHFPFSFSVESGRSYPKPVVTFHVPFDGDSELLKCRPSTHVLWSDEVLLSGNELLFDVINFSNNADEVKRERDSFISNLEKQVGYLNKDVETYNSQLEETVKVSIKIAKTKFEAQDDLLSKLGNPMKDEKFE